jgi:hypothetical protein
VDPYQQDLFSTSKIDCNVFSSTPAGVEYFSVKIQGKKSEFKKLSKIFSIDNKYQLKSPAYDRPSQLEAFSTDPSPDKSLMEQDLLPLCIDHSKCHLDPLLKIR